MKANWLDRVVLAISPRAGFERMRFRAATEVAHRHFEGASRGRRTQNWNTTGTDANTVAQAAIHTLRERARYLARNNPHAARAKRSLSNYIVGFGIMGKADPSTAGARAVKAANNVWNRWANSTACDFDGRKNFAGIQRLAARTVVEAGEALVIRHRSPELFKRGMIPLQLQVLEPDYIDTNKSMNGVGVANGHYVIQGVEFNAQHRRVAYWLYKTHPGATLPLQVHVGESYRVPAEDVRHIYRADRAGQVRGITWFAPCIIRFRDFDEYEDATLLRQKIAACFAVFVTDTDGNSTAVGPTSTGSDGEQIETIEPGMKYKLAPGQDVSFATPPSVGDYKDYAAISLRSIAMGLGIPYEILTGDLGNVTFISGRLGLLPFWEDLDEWRWDMLIPQLCDGAWNWAMEAALIAGLVGETPRALWTPPPPKMVEPDREIKSNNLAIRTGQENLFTVLRERGYDPEEFLRESATVTKLLDELGLILDSDPRNTTQVGGPRQQVAQNAGAENTEEPEPEKE